MIMIVTDFEKFRYNCLTMGMCHLGYIFQSKVDKLLGNIEGVKRYIDNALILSKYFFTKHIEQPRTILVDCAQKT